ncbi:MAG TPA: hypothetical protein VHN74_17325 [Candidatus Angelobacter sp.]|jgi:hypothetical protein|nr:hypothetical protein [Candidatus Angelobacter sp.]
MKHHSRSAIRLVALSLGALSAFAFSGPADNTYRATTPAGYNVVELKPSGTLIALLGLFECPQLQGAQHVSQGLGSRVVLPDGALMERFPRQFSIRVTASLRKTLTESPEFTAHTDQSPEEFLLRLKFRLRAFDGLDHSTIEPRSVTMIGMPADLPYDERIYKLSYDVGEWPVSSRFLLEVYSPNGEKIGRFTFGLL